MKDGSIEYLRDMVHELADIAEENGVETLAYVLRMAETAAKQEIEERKSKCAAR